MNKYAIQVGAIILAVPMLLTAAGAQGNSQGKGKGRDKHDGGGDHQAQNIVVVFSSSERGLIDDWFWSNRNGLPPGLAKRESLPPGLQKQLRRNGTLPPGLQKKYTSLPYELDSRLMRLPADFIRVIIGRDLVLLDRRNNSIVDILASVIRDPNEKDRYRERAGDDDRDYARRESDRDGRDRDNHRDDGYVTSAPTSAPAPEPVPVAVNRAPAPRNATNTGSNAKGIAQVGSQTFPLKVRLTTALSTATVKTGDSFVAVLEEPIYDGSRIVARQGATVEGTIVDADKGGRIKNVASLSVALARIKLQSGQYLNVTSDSISTDANATKAKDAAKIGIASGIGTAIGAIAGGGKGAVVGAATGAAAGTGVVLATRGDPAVIPSETVLEFNVRSN